MNFVRVTPLTKKRPQKVETPEHTSYPWKVVVEQPNVQIVDAEGLVIVAMNCPPHFRHLSLAGIQSTLQYANAKRIVDCVNMCNGYSVKKMRVMLAPKTPNSWYRLNRMRKCTEAVLEVLRELTQLLRELAKKHPEYFEDDAIEAVAKASSVTTQVTTRIDELYSENWSLRNVRKE